MAKVPKRVIREAQIRANTVIKWYGDSPHKVWNGAMAGLRLNYNRAKAEAKEYGFNNQPSHGTGTSTTSQYSGTGKGVQRPSGAAYYVRTTGGQAGYDAGRVLSTF